MKLKTPWLSALLRLATAVPAQVINPSKTRVQSALDPGLKRIGILKPRPVGEIAGQNWSLGCETLDRAFTSYDSYKDYLVPLGTKRIRLQGGWPGMRRGMKTVIELFPSRPRFVRYHPLSLAEKRRVQTCTAKP